MAGSSDPAVIRSIAVSVEDLVAAVEMNRTTPKQAVLRITPPFSGRMRARLHVEGGEAYDDTPPIHVDPDAILADDAPAYPRPSDTEDELRQDPSLSYTVERHHERHTAAVDAWRTELTDAIRSQATIETPAGPQTVSVALLGGSA